MAWYNATGKENHKSLFENKIYDRLRDLEIPCEVRLLPVGDFVWIWRNEKE